LGVFGGFGKKIPYISFNTLLLTMKRGKFMKGPEGFLALFGDFTKKIAETPFNVSLSPDTASHEKEAEEVQGEIQKVQKTFIPLRNTTDISYLFVSTLYSERGTIDTTP
jgi:hypothetical protein